MQIEAVVVPEVGTVGVETVQLEPPGPCEVLVQNHAAGVCHSDLHTMRGELRTAPPLVLGHEGAGVVQEVGAEVTRVKAGDHVVYNWLPSCNHCEPCLSGRANLCQRFPATMLKGLLPNGKARLRSQSGALYKHYLGVATMSDYMVTHEACLIPCSPDIPKPVAAIVGCAVITGAGAVWNTAQAQPGQALAVIGCGGIGLCAVVGALAAGCSPIIGVDLDPKKLVMAQALGADLTLNTSEHDLVEGLQEMTGGGPEYIIDSVGSGSTIGAALAAVRPGGKAVIVGMHSLLTEVNILPVQLVAQNKQLLGSYVGSSRTYVDIPRVLRAYQRGRLNLDGLITKTYPLREIDMAFADMEAGNVARGVLTMA